jgi:hypothetical protein
VLTLRNGSAFAGVSISCLEKQTDAARLTPIPTIVTSEKTDNFVRDETTVRIMTPAGGGSPIAIYNYPKGGPNWFRDVDNSTVTPFQEYTYLTNPNNASTQVTVMISANSPPPGGGTYTYDTTGNSDTDGWILAQLTPTGARALTSANGTIVGPNDPNQSFTVVATASCAASLHI